MSKIVEATAEPVIAFEPRKPGTRRSYTSEQKRMILEEAARPGNSISGVARQFGIAPSLVFHWKRQMEEGANTALAAGEAVVPESEAKLLRSKVRELEARAPAWAQDDGGRDPQRGGGGRPLKKMAAARLLVERGRWSVSAIARALGVSRPHLSATHSGRVALRYEETVAGDPSCSRASARWSTAVAPTATAASPPF